MTTYRAALVGCGRIGAFIDNEGTQEHAYSHAAAYEVCERTELVALSDPRTDVMAKAGERYGVPEAHRYSDYRQMLEEENPDIVSVTTQPEQRAEIVVFAADHGARAIYAEKAMAASLTEADSMVAAIERNGCAFNMGTNRRWEAGYEVMRSLIAEGQYGALKSLTVHSGYGLFNMGSHAIDLLLWLNGDSPVGWVQFHISEHADQIDGTRLREDPTGGGRLQFQNGIPAFLLDSGRGFEVEAVCERGVVTSLGGDFEWQVREQGGTNQLGKPILRAGRFPEFKRSSAAVNLIMDLVTSLDTGAPTRGGVRVARMNTELIFACLESHLHGGARVELPLARSELKLERELRTHTPTYERKAQ